jgi:hypothetical protein
LITVDKFVFTQESIIIRDYPEPSVIAGFLPYRDGDECSTAFELTKRYLKGLFRALTVESSNSTIRSLKNDNGMVFTTLATLIQPGGREIRVWMSRAKVVAIVNPDAAKIKLEKSLDSVVDI